MENMNNTNTTEIAVVKEDLASVELMDALMNPSSNFFCSIEPKDRKDKARIYNAINSTEKRVEEIIGKTIEIADVVAHPITITDKETGEIINTIRTVIIDKNGVGYQAVSEGIVNSLQKLFTIFGMPSWKDEPIKVEVRQVATRNGNNKINTLVAVE